METQRNNSGPMRVEAWDYELTREDVAAIRRLRDKGCAVSVFVPCEVQHSNARLIEEEMVSAGWRKIDWDMTNWLLERGYNQRREENA
jgi:hypothetical protein